MEILVVLALFVLAILGFLLAIWAVSGVASQVSLAGHLKASPDRNDPGA